MASRALSCLPRGPAAPRPRSRAVSSEESPARLRWPSSAESPRWYGGPWTQITRSRDGIEPARMERMTAHQTPHGQPGTPDCPVPHDRLERVLRAGWREATARRQDRGDDELVTPGHAGQQVTGEQPELLHGDSPGTQD